MAGGDGARRGAYGVLGASVPLFGGAAGDGWRMSGTFQLHGSDVFSNGASRRASGRTRRSRSASTTGGSPPASPWW
ncbi:FIST N-terminal domain-containing protein [Dactylosporangium sp. CA-139066]|uniref:FIST N-terminal domain-containing protein n=1 Tax=Dactylosporangium sp. CA-139066 TaxID=3239930 RepID=UPI003D89F3E2